MDKQAFEKRQAELRHQIEQNNPEMAAQIARREAAEAAERERKAKQAEINAKAQAERKARMAEENAQYFADLNHGDPFGLADVSNERNWRDTQREQAQKDVANAEAKAEAEAEATGATLVNAADSVTLEAMGCTWVSSTGDESDRDQDMGYAYWIDRNGKPVKRIGDYYLVPRSDTLIGDNSSDTLVSDSGDDMASGNQEMRGSQAGIVPAMTSTHYDTMAMPGKPESWLNPNATYLRFTLLSGETVHLSGRKTIYVVREWRIGKDYRKGWYEVATIAEHQFGSEADARAFIEVQPPIKTIYINGAVANKIGGGHEPLLNTKRLIWHYV